MLTRHVPYPIIGISMPLPNVKYFSLPILLFQINFSLFPNTVSILREFILFSCAIFSFASNVLRNCLNFFCVLQCWEPNKCTNVHDRSMNVFVIFIYFAVNYVTMDYDLQPHITMSPVYFVSPHNTSNAEYEHFRATAGEFVCDSHIAL